jgi:DNA-binding HxlR family transcriptional regulator
MERPLRFSEISAGIPEISDRSLSLRLKELETEGIVVRAVASSQPVSVTYRLTEKGRALESAIGAIEQWAHDWVSPRGPGDDLGIEHSAAG